MGLRRNPPFLPEAGGAEAHPDPIVGPIPGRKEPVKPTGIGVQRQFPVPGQEGAVQVVILQGLLGNHRPVPGLVPGPAPQDPGPPGAFQKDSAGQAYASSSGLVEAQIQLERPRRGLALRSPSHIHLHHPSHDVRTMKDRGQAPD